MVLNSGEKVVINAEKCGYCDSCVKACPTGSITESYPGLRAANIRQETCEKCGICLGTCKRGAVYIKISQQAFL